MRAARSALGRTAFKPFVSLKAVFGALLDGPVVPSARSHAPIAPEPKMQRLGNRRGAVRRRQGPGGDRPMRLAYAQTAVEAPLGQPVSKDSINWCLSTGARGSKPRFERVARGCYRLRR